MTTSPWRMQLFQPVINSILQQTLKPDAILLNLPELFRNTTRYSIPRWLSECDRIQTCVSPEPDYGPAMKLIPALTAEPAPDTIIITIDDDVIYPRDALGTFAEASMAEPGTAFCSMGFRFETQSFNILPVRGHGNSCDVLQGFSACCYRRSHFTGLDLIHPLAELPAEYRINDDVILSNHVAKNGINRKTVEFQQGKLRFMPWSDDDPDALKSAGDGTHARYQDLRRHLQKNGDWHITPFS